MQDDLELWIYVLLRSAGCHQGRQVLPDILGRSSTAILIKEITKTGGKKGTVAANLALDLLDQTKIVGENQILFFFILFYIIHECACQCRCLQRLYVSCELPDVHSGNRTRVLWRSSQCS